MLIPTGNRVKACYVFEPIVGHHKHFGVIIGSFLDRLLWEDEENERKLQWVLHTNSQYLFEKKEMRSFDLKYKPWSRYMKVYESKEQANEAHAATGLVKSQLGIPGINVFTQCLCVRPRFSFNLNHGFLFSWYYS